MCKVAEMELSLMYDILYTKAAVIHTMPGYVIRIISPMVNATVIVLFLLYSKEGQRKADVIVTYIMLSVTFLLDVRWLLAAAASTHCWIRAVCQVPGTLGKAPKTLGKRFVECRTRQTGLGTGLVSNVGVRSK
jgi:hypothetical protein